MESGTSHANTTDLQPPSGLLSDRLFWPLMVGTLTLDVLTALVATVANIVTILVYRKLGFADSTNVSLAALALSDLIVSFSTLTSVLAILLPIIPNVPFTMEIFFYIAFTPHVMATRTSALITSYISVERYLCVLIPLKIKRLITSVRTSIAMITVFVAGFIGWPIDFAIFPMRWRYVPELNRTLLRILIPSDPTSVALRAFNQAYYPFFLPLLTFLTVVVCTSQNSRSLQKSKIWRDANRSTTGTGRDEETVAIKSKEARAVKMVITIATVFIISTIPSNVHMIAVIAVPAFDLGGSYTNLYTVTGMAYYIADCLNCSANVFIYYKMSSKFKKSHARSFR